MSSKPSRPLEFKPNQLVLCRYECYPYWPAKITNNFPTEVKEGYRCQLATNEGKYFFYWCLFCNEEKGGWVREDRILQFHPSLVRYAQISTDNLWYQEQQKAFRAAFKLFNALHSKALRPKPVNPIPDLLDVYKHGGDIHEAEDEQDATPQIHENDVKVEADHESADTPAERESSLKKESSVAESSHHRVTGKRVTIQHDASESDNQKPVQRQRLDNMRTESTPSGVGQLGEGAEVTFFAPPPPEECLASLPDKTTYHSRPTSSASFSRMMSDLSQRVAAYTDSWNDAEEAHHIFDVEKENIRRKYKDLFERLRQIERCAADDKKYLIMLLEDILQAKVDIADLTRLRAGRSINKLGNECRDVTAIHLLCEKITQVWTDLVTLHFKG